VEQLLRIIFGDIVPTEAKSYVPTWDGVRLFERRIGQYVVVTLCPSDIYFFSKNDQ
jgi:hypothetical protein